MAKRCSPCGQLERFCLGFQEEPTERSHLTIKLCCCRSFQINEEATNPRGEMFLEKILLHSAGRWELAAGHPGHDLAKSSSVILRLHLSLGAFDTVRAEILAQSRQRPFVEKAGEVIRSVGKQIAASNSNEQGEIFARDAFCARIAGCLRKGYMRQA